ncbi:MAG: hypothetical protein IPM64_10295 [Phycisphaerales bacterium]|nr:hypothetical protein [Phycisphaerales bacterium]
MPSQPAPGPDNRRLTIKKYSNRRFYDATRSCHVTLSDMYTLICGGHDLTIIDSETREDITNVVLTQIILERDAPKLTIFPANILHQMIRTKHHMLDSVLEQFFHQVLSGHRESQERWARFLQNTLGFMPPAASASMDWSRQWMDMFAGRGAGPRSAADAGTRSASDTGPRSDFGAAAAGPQEPDSPFGDDDDAPAERAKPAAGRNSESSARNSDSAARNAETAGRDSDSAGRNSNSAARNAESAGRNSELEELRKQVSDLTRRVEKMTRPRGR